MANTVSKDLDDLHTDVIEILSSSKPVNYEAAARVMFSQFAVTVSADNLRAWHVRRVADRVIESTKPDVRCPIDDYAEAISSWRNPIIKRNWATISSLLSQEFGFQASQQTLRAWWHRRKMQAEKSRTTIASTPPQSSQPAISAALQGRSAAPGASTSLNKAAHGETEIQRQIRIDREEKASKEQRHSNLLDKYCGPGNQS